MAVQVAELGLGAPGFTRYPGNAEPQLVQLSEYGRHNNS